MNEEIKREEVVEFLNRWIIHGWSLSDKDVRLLSKAIEYIQQAPKYRKKAKHWKRKMALRSKVEKIKAEIAEDLANTLEESRQTQDDIDCGEGIGLQMALITIDKYREKGEEE